MATSHRGKSWEKIVHSVTLALCHFSAVTVKTEFVYQSENRLTVPKVQNIGIVSQRFQSAGGADSTADTCKIALNLVKASKLVQMELIT